MNEEIISINVSNLLLNMDNPRFDDMALNQRDAINKLVQEQQDKLVNLASDIIANGLNSMEKIAVTKGETNTYIVREGNRRIATLKLLFQPNLIEAQNKNLFDKFKQLSKKFMEAPISILDCVIYKDEHLLNRFIELKHTGENGGIGVAAWDTIQKRRFDEKRGKHPVIIKAIDFILDCEKIAQEIKDNIYRMAITNFERLIGDPYVRSAMGISSSKNGPFVIDITNSETFDLFVCVLRDLIFNDNFNVKQIYYQADRKQYIEDIKKTLDATRDVTKLLSRNSNDNGSLENGDSITSEDKQRVSNEKKSPVGQAPINHVGITSPHFLRRNSLPTNRKNLIPSSCKIKIKHPRLNKIYHELSGLEVTEYTNACSVLFRTFIELSLDVYAKNKKIQGYSSEKLQLHQKINNVSQYMQNNNIMTMKELKPIELLSNFPQGVSSVNTLNAYVHNSEMIPLADNLKNSWDSITSFIQKIYE